MIALLAAWLLQDILQAMAMGILLVPEVFLLMVIYKLIQSSPRVDQAAILMWLAFAGGALWDMRWVTYPGVSCLVNSMSVLAVYAVWRRMPAAGRGAALFGFLAGMSHFLSGIAHYAAWSVPGQTAVRIFLIQQLLSVPILALMCIILAFKENSLHV